MVFVNKSVLPWGSLYAPRWRKDLIMVLNMLALSCSVVGIVLVVEKRTMPKLSNVSSSFCGMYARLSGIGAGTTGALGGNSVFIFYRRKFTAI